MGLTGNWIARAAQAGRSRRLRTIVLIVVCAFAIFNLAGFFGVPLLLHYLAGGRVAAALHRQVTVGKVRFNPYTLRLSAKDLLISERDDSQKFAYVGQIRIKASWSSLYRLAPIIQELTIDTPAVHIVRTRAQRFNFSDLIQTPGPPPPAASSGKRLHFALSNIRLNDGQVWFDDQAFNEHHKVDRIQIGVPFIANLPADTEIFVQPLVRMIIDGSPFRVMGLTKPFASTSESTLDFRLKSLDLTRVAAYLAHTIPIKIPRGTVSSRLQVHFVQPLSGPVIKLSGTVNVDALDVRDAANAPLVSFKSAKVALDDVEPLQQIAIVGDIGVDGLSAGLVRNAGGTTNLTPLTAAFAPSRQAAAAKNGEAKNKDAAPFYLFVRSFNLANSQLNLRDNSAAAPVAMAFKSVHVGFKDFDTNKRAPPVAFQAQAHLGDGSLALAGTLDLPHLRAATQATLDQIDLPPLQAYAQPFWAGTIVSGKLSAKAQVQTDLAAGKFNVHVQPAGFSLDTLELRAPGDTQQPVQLKNLSVALDQVDLNARQATVKEVRLDGLRLSMRRSRDGAVSLDAFLRPPQSSAIAPTGAPAPARSGRIAVQSQPVMIVPGTAAKPAPPPAPVWQYRIASIAVENVETELEDDSAARPIVIKATPLNVHLKDVSNDLTKPIALEIDAALKPTGGFKIRWDRRCQSARRKTACRDQQVRPVAGGCLSGQPDQRET